MEEGFERREEDHFIFATFSSQACCGSDRKAGTLSIGRVWESKRGRTATASGRGLGSIHLERSPHS